MPLSAVGDTLTLPFTNSAEVNKKETTTNNADWREGFKLPEQKNLTFDRIHGGIE